MNARAIARGFESHILHYQQCEYDWLPIVFFYCNLSLCASTCIDSNKILVYKFHIALLEDVIYIERVAGI